MNNILKYKEYSTMRNIWKMKWKNDGFRSLLESVVHPEVIRALRDWKRNCNSNYVLIGGLALAYYIRPRSTDDLDLIFLSEDDIPTEVRGFKKHRPHAFQHIFSHVEVEVITAKEINKNESIFKKTFETAIESDGIMVASPLSLIIFKLNRFNTQDVADIYQLLEYCKENGIIIDIEDYGINDNERKNFLSLDLNYDNFRDNKYLLETYSFFRENRKHKKIDSNLPYDIYIFDDYYGRPHFHFGKNMAKTFGTKTYEDFQFDILLESKMVDTIVLNSSTGYKSFNGFREEEKLLKEWLFDNDRENLKMMVSEWKKINNR